jgi:hypothetical protein
MLNEYHGLYELQRRRLEDVVSQLSHDQELWQQAAYELAWKVASEYDIQTLQRMQLNEKAWCKLASHFAILLGSKNTKQVSKSIQLNYQRDNQLRVEVDHTHNFSRQSDKLGEICGSRCVLTRLHETYMYS